MAGFPKKDRQKIVDGYLAATGRNMFIPGEFIDWLKTQKDHPAYSWFEFDNDEKVARRERVNMARRLVSGLRISMSQEIKDKQGNVVIKVTEFPAMISPMDGRRNGGGYESFDPTDAKQVEELKRLGLIGLKGWLNRYAGVLPDVAHHIHREIEAIEAAKESA